MDPIDKFLKLYSYKFPKGYPDMNDKQDILLMESILKEEFNIVLEKEQSYPEYYSRLTDEQKEILSNNLNYNKNQTFKSGKKYTPKSLDKDDNYTKEDLEKILNDFDKPVYLTYAKSAIKLRTPFGIRIMGFDPSNIKLDNDNFHRMKVLDQLIKDNPDKIIVKSKLPAGLGYEEAQVSNIDNAVKDFLESFPNQNDIELFIDMEPQGVNINGAIKRKGSGKADIALTNDNKEVYWISYKEGAYRGEDGTVLSKIPFQQYGSLKTLYGTEFDGEMAEFGNYFNNLVRDFLDAIKESKQNLVFKDIETVDYENGNIISKTETISLSGVISNDFIKGATGLKSKELTNAIKKGPIDIVFIESGESYYNAFVKDNDPNSRLLAGKSVYGVDFDFNNKDYNSENCNVLLQSDGTVELNAITGDEDNIIGLNIEMEGGTGNVIFHPDLPTRSDEPLYGYTPALNLRHTKSQVFVYKSKDGNTTAVIGGRFLIYPLGGIGKSSTEIKL
jgi:hypothetical protein|tara:strand:- start:77 stop:1582 length:1506 start_codon:yes stop_codon:yes gene_type:complete